jgi:hypothetical protein
MCDFSVVEMDELSPKEKRRLEAFKEEIRHWHQVLLLDPFWRVGVAVLEDDDSMMDGRTAYADIGRSEYLEAEIGISRKILGLSLNAAAGIRRETMAHEMLHLFTADYHRAAVAAAGNDSRLHEELTYRYEQLITKLSRILCSMDDEIQKVARKKRKKVK